MTKPSDQKANRIAEFARLRDVLLSAASLASTADAALVEYAAHGVHACLAWNKAQLLSKRHAIHASGYHMEQGAIRNAKQAGKASRFNLAARAYGRALQEFAACEYAGAQHSLNTVDTLLKG